MLFLHKSITPKGHCFRDGVTFRDFKGNGGENYFGLFTSLMKNDSTRRDLENMDSSFLTLLDGGVNGGEENDEGLDVKVILG